MGLPVIASRLGSLAGIVAGWFNSDCIFPRVARKISRRRSTWAWAHPGEMESMGQQARANYRAKYTADVNYGHLVGLWEHLGLRVPA